MDEYDFADRLSECHPYVMQPVSFPKPHAPAYPPYAGPQSFLKAPSQACICGALCKWLLVALSWLKWLADSSIFVLSPLHKDERVRYVSCSESRGRPPSSFHSALRGVNKRQRPLDWKQWKASFSKWSLIVPFFLLYPLYDICGGWMTLSAIVSLKASLERRVRLRRRLLLISYFHKNRQLAIF